MAGVGEGKIIMMQRLTFDIPASAAGEVLPSPSAAPYSYQKEFAPATFWQIEGISAATININPVPYPVQVFIDDETPTAPIALGQGQRNRKPFSRMAVTSSFTPNTITVLIGDGEMLGPEHVILDAVNNSASIWTTSNTLGNAVVNNALQVTPVGTTVVNNAVQVDAISLPALDVASLPTPAIPTAIGGGQAAILLSATYIIVADATRRKIWLSGSSDLLLIALAASTFPLPVAPAALGLESQDAITISNTDAVNTQTIYWLTENW